MSFATIMLRSAMIVPPHHKNMHQRAKQKNQPDKIIEFCSAKYASVFLDKDPLIGLCMPCKINVYEQSGQVFIAGMRPAVLPEFFPNLELEEQVIEIDRLIHNIVNQAKSDLNQKGGGI